jgi:hypothetical protein
VQDLVIGAIDDTHSAFANLANHATMAQNCSDHKDSPVQFRMSIGFASIKPDLFNQAISCGKTRASLDGEHGATAAVETTGTGIPTRPL